MWRLTTARRLRQLRLRAQCVLCSGTCRRDIKTPSQAARPVETCRDSAPRVYLSEHNRAPQRL